MPQKQKYETLQIESHSFYCNLAGFFNMILEHMALAMLSVQNI